MSDFLLDSLASHLKNDAGVTAELTAATDVYIDVAEPGHGARYITISSIPTGEFVRHQGGSSGLSLGEFQINAWSENDSIEPAKTGNAVRLAINLLANGGVLGTAPNNKTVKSAFIDEPGGAVHVPPRTGGPVGTHGWQQMASIWHNITKPS